MQSDKTMREWARAGAAAMVGRALVEFPELRKEFALETHENGHQPLPVAPVRKRRKHSAAARRLISARMKAAWAARRKAAGRG